MALKSPMPEHTHIERPFQVNQYLERSLLLPSTNEKLLYNVYNKDVVSKPLEDKLFLLSILFNIKKQNFKYDYFLKSEMKIFIAFNPRLKSEEASLFKLVRKLKSWNYPTEYHPRYNARVKFKKIN